MLRTRMYLNFVVIRFRCANLNNSQPETGEEEDKLFYA